MVVVSHRQEFWPSQTMGEILSLWAELSCLFSSLSLQPFKSPEKYIAGTKGTCRAAGCGLSGSYSQRGEMVGNSPLPCRKINAFNSRMHHTILPNVFLLLMGSWRCGHQECHTTCCSDVNSILQNNIIKPCSSLSQGANSLSIYSGSNTETERQRKKRDVCEQLWIHYMHGGLSQLKDLRGTSSSWIRLWFLEDNYLYPFICSLLYV